MATIKDVAEAAGVSIASVSATLNASGRVGEATRERIWAAVRAVGYAPNAVARSLRLGTSRLIGMVVGDITNPFVGELIMTAERVAREAGFALIVCTIDEDTVRTDAVLARLRAQHVAGILITPTGRRADDLRRLARPDLPPLVTVDHHVPGARHDFVGTDNRALARMLVDHLVALGHRKIALISGRRGLWTADERCRGFLGAAAALGLAADDVRCIRADYRGQSGLVAARALLGRPDRPTAIIGGNNVIALGVLKACLEAGLDCPADLSICGIDDVPWSELVRPQITTAAQPTGEIATVATRRLLERIELAGHETAPRHIELAPTLILGESCGPVTAAARRGDAPITSQRLA